MDPLVSVCCTTFNHQGFIDIAIESFLSQITDFPFEIIIYDDASTDNTTKIITDYVEKFPDTIIPIYQKENQYSKGIKPWAHFVFPRARGKYISICDGDDYWTDPYKLQKQVEFLESNHQFGMVSGAVQLIDQNNQPLPPNDMIIYQKRRNIPEPTFMDLFQGNFINTSTVCARADILKKLSTDIHKRKLWYVFDYWFWLHISIKKKVKIFAEETTAYRIHAQGISRSTRYIVDRISFVRLDALGKFFKYIKKGLLTPKDKLIITTFLYFCLLDKNCPFLIRRQAFFLISKNPIFMLYLLKKTISIHLNG